MGQPCAKLSLVILNGLAALPGSTGSEAAFPPYCDNFKPHVIAMLKASPVGERHYTVPWTSLCDSNVIATPSPTESLQN